MKGPVERKYVLTKVKAGDYLLPSNDGRTLWRIARYTDGPSSGLDTPRDREYWGAWKWGEPVFPGAYIDTQDWSRWDLWEQFSETRADAVRQALASEGNR